MPSTDTQFKKGHQHKQETLAKISASLKGKTSWNKGTKGVMKAWNKGKKNLQVSPLRGIKLSEEHKKKLSLSHKKERPYMRREKCNLWKGGITPINIAIRTSLEYKLWRTAVFERDNYTCIWCGAKSGNGKAIVLNADHIKRFSDYPELRFAIDNGRTLCVHCHKTTDTWGRPKKNG